MSSHRLLLSSSGGLRGGRSMPAGEPRHRFREAFANHGTVTHWKLPPAEAPVGGLLRPPHAAIQEAFTPQALHWNVDSSLSFEASVQSPKRFSAFELNRRIQRAKTAGHLEAVLHGSWANLTHVNIATSAVKLARLRRKGGQEGDRTMQELTEAARDKMAHFRGRQLSNFVWALAKYFQGRNKPDLNALLAVIERQAVSCWHANQFTAPHELSMLLLSFTKLKHYPVELLRTMESELPDSALLQGFGPQEVSNFVWACAKLRHRRRPLLDALAVLAADVASQASPKELSITSWGFAKLQHTSPAVTAMMAAFATEVSGSLGKFKAMDLSNLAWACARLGCSEATKSLMAEVVAEACPRIGEFSPQGQANLVWSMARSKSFSPMAMDSVAEAVTKTMEAQSPQGLANIASAFAHADGSKTPQVEAAIDSLAKAAVAAVPRLDAQNMANIIWALGKIGHRSADVEALAVEISLEASHHSREFNAQGISNLLCGFAHLGVCSGESPLVEPDRLMDAFTPHVLRQCPRLGPQDVSNLAWAYARFHYADSEAVPALAVRGQEILKELTPQGISNLVWALGSLNVYTVGLLDAVAARVSQGTLPLSSFSEQALANLFWGYAKLDYVRPEGLMSAVVKEARSRLPSLSPKTISSIVMSCADLACPSVPLFRDVDKLVLERLAEFQGAQGEALISAYARLGYRSSAAFAMLGQAAESALQSLVDSPDFSVQSEWDLRRRKHYTALMVEVFCSGTLPNMPNGRVPGQLPQSMGEHLGEGTERPVPPSKPAASLDRMQ